MLANRQNLGLLLGVLGVAVFAGSLPASRIAVTEVDPYFLTAMRATLISWAVLISLPLSALALILTWPADAGAISARVWLAMLYAGLMAQFVGFFLFNAAMGMAGISRIGQIGLLQPFFVVLIAALVAREPIDPLTIAFAAAVVATVAVGTRLRVGRPAAGG